jgi:integrase/recombinase XerD
MINQYIKPPLLLAEFEFIPTGIIHQFLHFLISNGYVTTSISQYAAVVIHFAQWLRLQGRDCTFVSAQDKTNFMTLHLAKCQCPRPFPKVKKAVAAALSHWLRLVGQQGADLDMPNKQADLVKCFDDHMKDLAGLAHETREYRRRYAAEFLTWIAASPTMKLDTLTFDPLSNTLANADTVSRPSLAVITSSLNCFLRFLSVGNYSPVGADICVPHPKLMYNVPTAKPFTEEDIQLLFAAIDRSNPVGKRDYAILRCLADLGMRTSEVANLNLDYIDWHNKELTMFCTKQRRQRKLSIPDTLMAALVDYMTQGRPNTATRFVFVYHRAPLGMPIQTSTVGGIVARIFAKAGVLPAHGKAHGLRHAVASQLLVKEVPLKIIADVLGHQCIDTTIRYTHVERHLLNAVALPWLGRKTS